MNRRAFLQALASILPAAWAAKAGLSEPPDSPPWEAQGDPMPRAEHVKCITLGPHSFVAETRGKIEPGMLLEIHPDGRLGAAKPGDGEPFAQAVRPAGPGRWVVG